MRRSRGPKVSITTPLQARRRHVVSMAAHTFFFVFTGLYAICFVVLLLVGPSAAAMATALGTCVTLASIAAALTAFGAHRYRLEDERRSFGHCVRCGYDLRESEERCPECGHRFIRRAVS
jgi:hypothetical protein